MASKAERLVLQEFAQEHRSCAVCHWPESDMRRRMEIHHLVGGAGRKHDRRNLLTLCNACHTVLHGGSRISGRVDVNRGTLLTAKLESDPDYYAPTFLASLKRKKHLGYDPEPIPDWYLQERQRNVRGWIYRRP